MPQTFRQFAPSALVFPGPASGQAKARGRPKPLVNCQLVDFAARPHVRLPRSRLLSIPAGWPAGGEPSGGPRLDPRRKRTRQRPIGSSRSMRRGRWRPNQTPAAPTYRETVRRRAGVADRPIVQAGRQTASARITLIRIGPAPLYRRKSLACRWQDGEALAAPRGSQTFKARGPGGCNRAPDCAARFGRRNLGAGRAAIPLGADKAGRARCFGSAKQRPRKSERL